MVAQLLGSSACRVRALVILSLAFILSLIFAAAARGEDAAELLRSQLAAGEFAPAMAVAQQADPKVRDQWLGMVASAQARSGSRNASLNTAAQISDDLERAAVVKEASARGHQGGNQADFDSLIELITTTVAPTTWDEVGGPGAIHEFRTGVHVDAEGVLRRVIDRQKDNSDLLGLRIKSATLGDNFDARRPSSLRKVSLTRLEKQVQLRLAAGLRVTDEMSVLAGLEKIKYVLVYPETHDIVLVGPAGNWKESPEGRLVGAASGRPVLQLDDLIVVLRHLMEHNNAIFGCSITPTDQGLADLQNFLTESSKKPLKPGQRAREAWLTQVRDKLGKQTISVDGIDPRTRVGQVIVEADYRMKLVGMGLEEGTLGVDSYLKSIKLKKGETAPPMEVLRWWFTMNYQAVQATSAGDAYELRGQGVQVLSENELLAAQGKRVHTGKSDPLNMQFAQSFTDHFALLAQKYPVYAELQNIFDMALVSAIIKSEHLADKTGWHMTCFGDPGQYQVPLGKTPEMVETVINHRVIHETTILAGVSGGVHIDPAKYAQPGAIEVGKHEKLGYQLKDAKPPALKPDAWWWD